jgi:hypothetical protein
MQVVGEASLTNPRSDLAPVFADVDATIGRLAAKEFSIDPVVEARFSRITSIVSSAYKRHGAIIERAFTAALQRSPHLTVWDEREFRISAAAERLADGDATATGSALRYVEAGHVRIQQVDLLVFDNSRGRLGAYECKRGFGYHDAGKKRSMLRDIRCIQMLLRSYGEWRNLEIRSAEAHIIFYYGQCSVGAPWALTRDDLDEHFGTPVTEIIEQVNDYFRKRLNDLLAAV